MKIATFNVNSLRRRLDILVAWLEKNRPDVMCLQETKIVDAAFPAEALREAGYHAAFRGMKAYNGVATLTREKPEYVHYGIEDGPDHEDYRIVQVVVGGIPVLNTYVPQGQAAGTDRFAHKLAWFKRLRAYWDRHFDPRKPAVWLGDLNVAPEAIDVYDPAGLAAEPDFHPEARAAFKEAVAWGWVDTFRRLHPDRKQYTYWDFFRDHFQRDRGWRIDHILATEPLAEKLLRVEVDLEPRRAPSPSDHTVVWAEFDV